MPAKPNVNKEIAKGSIWMLLMRFSIKGLGLISTLILARILMPEDFGLIAMAMTFIAFIDLFQTIGVDMALIQNQQAGEAHYNTAWTIKVILGALCGLVVVIFAPFTASFFDEPKLESVLYVLSLGLFLYGFPNIGLVDFQKKMTFKYDFYYQVLTKLLSFFITIGAALTLRNYWALIIGQLSGAVLRILLSYYIHPFRPKFSLSKWRELMGFSTWIFFNSLLRFINSQCQYIFLGRLEKSESVGHYKLSEEIATITTAEIVAPINRAAYPGYSKLSDEIQALKESYLNVFSMIALIAIPSAIGIMLVAPELVLVLLGEKWAVIAPMMQVVALGSVFSALSTNSTYIFFVLMRQKTVTAIMLFKSVVFIALLVYLIPIYGAIGAAYALLLSEVFTFPLWHVLVGRMLHMTISEWVRALYRPALASACMAVGVYTLREQFPLGFFDGILGLIGLSLSGALVFVCLITLLSAISSTQTLERKLFNNVITKIRGN